MGSVDLGAGDGRRGGKKGGPKKPKRTGFVLDMTPLVDIAFLLLTFFMFATTMAQPTMMEIKIPPNIEDDVEVEFDKIIAIYVDKNDKLYYSRGVDTAFITIDAKDIQNFSVKENAKKENDLVLTLKLHPEASYARLVEVLDELNKAETILTERYQSEKKMERKRKFSIQRLDSAAQYRLEQI